MRLGGDKDGVTSITWWGCRYFDTRLAFFQAESWIVTLVDSAIASRPGLHCFVKLMSVKPLGTPFPFCWAFLCWPWTTNVNTGDLATWCLPVPVTIYAYCTISLQTWLSLFTVPTLTKPNSGRILGNRPWFAQQILLFWRCLCVISCLSSMSCRAVLPSATCLVFHS